MPWHINEIVRSGNSTARIRSFNEDTNLIVLMDVSGEFSDGATIIGDESGMSGVLNGFSVSEEYESDDYRDLTWEEALEVAIYDGDGYLIVLDSYFTGLPSQDYQARHLISVDS